jgi:ATP-dependent protease HslVU (ClpYQ) peptidase subunit
MAGLRAKRRAPARYLSVALSGLADGTEADQLALFEETADAVETPRDRLLAKTVDAVREKYGNEALRRGRGSTER